MKGVEALRKEAANAGITETGPYIEWLEERVLELQTRCDDLAGVTTEPVGLPGFAVQPVGL